ncbi:MAG: bifunctional [glutamate--ammonia ligase]-adenylyl-L-tyrosine phosphorylase/[glutamate--ammonia-ligase] adenylyltransferase [Gammaproteobacteria bacterium]
MSMDPIELPLDSIPAELHPGLTLHWERYVDNAQRLGLECTLSPDFVHELARVWACSEFVAQVFIRDPKLLPEWDQTRLVDQPRQEGDVRRLLNEALQDVADEPGLATSLRRFRQREMARIAWRDLSGRADLTETLFDLSELASACIDAAVSRIQQWQRSEWGVPRGVDGEETGFVVLGMGKLGGGELNFSSDIDLIFAFGDDGVVDGPRDKTNREYFERLGRRVIKALDERTGDGFVYRVDMRLRPYGQSGPLVVSQDALEDYYTTTGRDWERYAMIKARPVAGDRALGEAVLDMLRPFIYRRYLDFGAFESLREMKSMIEAEMRRREMGDHVKLGRGGIREIEFIGQVFQLLRGGRVPQLRQRPILKVLAALAELGSLPRDVVDRLSTAYVFLRRCENRLQAFADQQTHVLPADETGKARLAFSMGFPDWEAFLAELDRHRSQVQAAFDDALAPSGESASSDRAEQDRAHALWKGLASEDDDQAMLLELGFDDPVAVRQQLKSFRTGNMVRALSEQGRQRLDRLMPLLLLALKGLEQADECLRRLLLILEAIARRTVYLSLLCESETALKQLVRLVAASPWVGEYIGRHPLLLDELLDPRTLLAPISREELQAELERRLAAVEAGDMENEMEALRQFKNANVLRTAAAEISGVKALMKVSDTLTDVAELVLEKASQLARRDFVQRWGRPRYRVDDAEFEADFAVIGYGKLGGIELGHTSDLDLVFLHDSHGQAQQTDGERGTDNEVFFARLGQRVMHYLNTVTPSGIAYEVDMRLRPSGNSGLLVSGMEAFGNYQRDKAWTWEHQALVRARFITGPEPMRDDFNAIRHEILSRRRDPQGLAGEVREMRQKMVAELGGKSPGEFQLKHDPGGIVDIEFMVQYGVLAWSTDCPDLTRWSDNVRILEDFARYGMMDESETELLTQAYLAYRSRSHELALLGRSGSVLDGEFSGYQRAVRDLWSRYLGA